MMKLTATIITLNEEADIRRTLDSLKFVDEIIVVDSGSTDNTVKIAQKYGAKVVAHPFISYSNQRNFADSLTDSKWILSLEADVVVPSKLAEEIKKAITDDTVKGYFVGRDNIIWGKNISVADWGPKDDNHIWLYQNGAGIWTSAVHEEYIVTGKTGQLQHHLLHYNYKTVSEFIDKINSYSDLAVKKNVSVSWVSPIIDFGKRYIYKLGFLAGLHGLFLSYLQAVYIITLKVKSWQRQYT